MGDGMFGIRNPNQYNILNTPEMFPNLRFGGIYGDMSMPPPSPQGPSYEPPPQLAEPPQPEMAQPTPYMPPAQKPRFSELFDPMIDAPSLDAPNPGPTSFDVEAEMNKYQPEHTATDRFNKLIDSRPEYQRPSALRTIASALSAFGPGGHQTGMAVMNEPNIRAQQAWKDIVAPAQQAANLERQNNVNERTLRHQTVSNQLRAKADEERAKNNERNALIREHRASVYEFKARNPNWVVVPSKGGTVKFRNPQTNEIQDSGIPSGTLTRMDELNLQADNRSEQIDQQAGNAKDLATHRALLQEHLRSVPQAKNWSPTQMAGWKKGLTPSQQANLERSLAQQVINTDPELGKWVVKEPGGGFKITPPGEPAGFFSDATGPTPEQYQKLKTLIYGEMQGEIKLDRGRAESIAPDPEAPKSSHPGYIYVRKPGGGWTAKRK